MTRCFLAAAGAGVLLVAMDWLLSPLVVQSEVVAALLSPGGLTLGRTATALSFVGLHLVAVFAGPALIVGGLVGVVVDRAFRSRALEGGS